MQRHADAVAQAQRNERLCNYRIEEQIGEGNDNDPTSVEKSDLLIVAMKLAKASGAKEEKDCVARSREVGHVDVGSTLWRSEGTLLVSFSECGRQQEAMLLMPPGAWLRTDVGKFVLRPFVSWPWSARLQLTSLNGEE
jgi:hypothetical protein